MSINVPGAMVLSAQYQPPKPPITDVDVALPSQLFDLSQTGPAAGIRLSPNGKRLMVAGGESSYYNDNKRLWLYEVNGGQVTHKKTSTLWRSPDYANGYSEYTALPVAVCDDGYMVAAFNWYNSDNPSYPARVRLCSVPANAATLPDNSITIGSYTNRRSCAAARYTEDATTITLLVYSDAGSLVLVKIAKGDGSVITVTPITGAAALTNVQSVASKMLAYRNGYLFQCVGNELHVYTLSGTVATRVAKVAGPSGASSYGVEMSEDARSVFAVWNGYQRFSVGYQFDGSNFTEVFRTMSLYSGVDYISEPTVSQDGKLFATLEWPVVKENPILVIYRGEDGAVLRKITMPSTRIATAAVFSADNNWLYATSKAKGGAITVYDTSSLKKYL